MGLVVLTEKKLKTSVLCMYKGGCMGCCGHDYKDADHVRDAIQKNTLEFKQFDNVVAFRDRAKPMNLRGGVCRNVVFKDGSVCCPLHPALNKGEELRKGHCDYNYLCPSAKKFNSWDEGLQKEFLNFIEEKDLDVIDYSIKMDKGSLMKEFLRRKR